MCRIDEACSEALVSVSKFWSIGSGCFVIHPENSQNSKILRTDEEAPCPEEKDEEAPCPEKKDEEAPCFLYRFKYQEFDIRFCLVYQLILVPQNVSLLNDMAPLMWSVRSGESAMRLFLLRSYPFSIWYRHAHFLIVCANAIASYVFISFTTITYALKWSSWRTVLVENTRAQRSRHFRYFVTGIVISRYRHLRHSAIITTGFSWYRDVFLRRDPPTARHLRHWRRWRSVGRAYRSPLPWSIWCII